MFSAASFLITFRETLEAALVIGIILAYLKQTRSTSYNKSVYAGIGGGLLLAFLTATVFETYLGEFEGRAEEIFEGVIMLFAAVLITFMIFWMKRQKAVSQRLKTKVQGHIDRQHPWGLFLLSALSVGREGVETVIFLNAAGFAGSTNPFWSGIAGIVIAILLGYVIFATTQRIPLKHFFNVTSALLILFAAGLVAHGVHEFQEAHLLPFWTQEVWDLNPAVVTEGVYPLWHEQGAIGSFLKALFGYNGDPTLLELMSYLAYLGLITYTFRKPASLPSKGMPTT